MVLVDPIFLDRLKWPRKRKVVGRCVRIGRRLQRELPIRIFGGREDASGEQNPETAREDNAKLDHERVRAGGVSEDDVRPKAGESANGPTQTAL